MSWFVAPFWQCHLSSLFPSSCLLLSLTLLYENPCDYSLGSDIQDQFPTSCLQRPFCHVRFQGLRHRHLWGTSVRPTAVSLNQKIWSFEVLLILPCKEGTFCNKRWSILSQRGFPGDAYGKEPKRCGFKPWVGKIPWRRKWQPTPVFLPGESMDRGAWRVIVHRDAESTEVT